MSFCAENCQSCLRSKSIIPQRAKISPATLRKTGMNLLNALCRKDYRCTKSGYLTFTRYFPDLRSIPAHAQTATEPAFLNSFLPGLDCVALYCLLAEPRPRLYLEVGSGNSTKFARFSIAANKLDTKIISIDPYPRAEIDGLCDEVIRCPVEEADLSLFDRLESNDVAFIDNSHRCFMNFRRDSLLPGHHAAAKKRGLSAIARHLVARRLPR